MLVQALKMGVTKPDATVEMQSLQLPHVSMQACAHAHKSGFDCDLLSVVRFLPAEKIVAMCMSSPGRRLSAGMLTHTPGGPAANHGLRR